MFRYAVVNLRKKLCVTAGAAEASTWAIDSSENHLLASQSSSISEKTAPSILMSERLDGKTWTTRERLFSSRLALS